jgi:hypothetical protein
METARGALHQREVVDAVVDETVGLVPAVPAREHAALIVDHVRGPKFEVDDLSGHLSTSGTNTILNTRS